MGNLFSKQSDTTDNAAVLVQFPLENQTTTKSSVLNSVLTGLQSKVSLTANELSVLNKEQNPEYRLKQLLALLNSRDSDRKVALEQLFDSTCEHGIRFSNLSQELDELYRVACARERTPNDTSTRKETPALTMNRPRSSTYGLDECLHRSRSSPVTLLSRSESGEFSNITELHLAHEMLQNPVDFCYKKAVLVLMDDGDHKNADMLQNILNGNHVSVSTESHKVVEVTLNTESSALVRAVVSRSSSFRKRWRRSQDKRKSPQQIRATNFVQLKRQVVRALLEQEISSTKTYPLTVYIRARSAHLCRDFVSLFLMGPNSLYLFIYNWINEPSVLSTESNQRLPHQEEILKWIHTIGFCSRIGDDSHAVSAKVVMTDFDNLMTSAGQQKLAETVADSPTRMLCEQLKGHKCGNIFYSKPLYLNFDDSTEQSDILRTEFEDAKFQTKSVDPRWIHLLCKISEKRQHPVLRMDSFIDLARSENLDDQEANKALSFFKELKIIFFLPSQSKSELRHFIFTDIEWLLNTMIELLTPPSFSDRGLLWNDWEQLTKSGIMTDDIKMSIERNLQKVTQVELPAQWVFTLLNEVCLFADISTKSSTQYFCPPYLLDDESEMKFIQVERDGIPSLYLRPKVHCVTDQYTMRLFCWILQCGFLTLQECKSRTHAIFLYREHNLRFTISCRLDSLKIDVESSFTGEEMDIKSACTVAQQLVNSIARASEDMRSTWGPVLLTKDETSSLQSQPDRYFQCCDTKCPKFSDGLPHLAVVVHRNGRLCLECEFSLQSRALTPQEEFWVDNFQITQPSTKKQSNSEATSKSRNIQKSKIETFSCTPTAVKSKTLPLLQSAYGSVGSCRKNPLCGERKSRSCALDSSSGGGKHILDRCFETLQNHLGVDMVAIRLFEVKLMDLAQVLAICKMKSYKNAVERSEAVCTIITSVKDNGPHGFLQFLKILEQTESSYTQHQTIITEIQRDPDYSSHLSHLP